jgi:transcriptional regulator with XRE-family HTH domain
MKGGYTRMPIPFRFAELLRRTRQERGLTQDELATIIGVRNVGAVKNWEQGRALPDDNKIEALSAVVSMSADDLRNLKLYEQLQGRGLDVDRFAEWTRDRMPNLRLAS